MIADQNVAAAEAAAGSIDVVEDAAGDDVEEEAVAEDGVVAGNASGVAAVVARRPYIGNRRSRCPRFPSRDRPKSNEIIISRKKGCPCELTLAERSGVPCIIASYVTTSCIPR